MPKQDHIKSKPRSDKALLVVFFLICSAASTCLSLWLLQNEVRLPSLSSKARKQVPQPEQYEILKQDIAIRKSRLAKRYKTAKNDMERKAVLSESRDLLEMILPEMMRCWLGTKWDFNGISETPGDGKIACGYFVNTVMRDAGFLLPRIKLSQQPSQTILGAFVPRSDMTIRTGMDYQAFHEMVQSKAPGIYIVGLDKHVGFIVHTGNTLHFIHSSGSAPWCVVDESKENAVALQRSHYRVIGNVTAQSHTLEKWLLNKSVYPTN
ncbi:MAG: hypothetical protein ABGY95_09820 [Rubritalea sp.]|uniref:hypothetical protein n=1 Tax=Rubritalea sp. TaxID=2109375 RepID=UPI003241CE03